MIQRGATLAKIGKLYHSLYVDRIGWEVHDSLLGLTLVKTIKELLVHAIINTCTISDMEEYDGEMYS